MKTVKKTNRRETIIKTGSVVNCFCLIALTVLFSVAAFGQSPGGCRTPQNEKIFAAEMKLSELGYWIVRVDCIADDSTRQALVAFQKTEGLKRNGVLTNTLLELLQDASRPIARYSGSAHIEIDVTRQLLFMVDETGSVARILPVSTGNEKRYFDEGKWQTARTPRGVFSIERKIAGVRRAPLGNLYNPNYFYRGVAIHGSNSVPPYPASHGCVRIPRFADRELSRMVWIGMRVYVYE